MRERIWRPTFVCLTCSLPVSAGRSGGLACPRCSTTIECRDGIYRFLSRDRLAELQPFLRQYRLVRERDGYRSRSTAYYRALPAVEAGHPQSAAWRVRQESYRRLCRRVLLRYGSRSLSTLDLGAGNAWLSYRLAALGHRSVAVDWLDDDEDGLGAWKHYGASFVCVQADFDRLPFTREQFDLIIFNGSLHYSPSVAATLSHAAGMLAPGGTLVVMDSPMFHREEDGREMLARKEATFRSDYGLTEIVRQGVGYLTLGTLAKAVRPLNLEPRFFASRGGAAWAAGRLIARIKLRREPAAFGVWVAR